MTTSVDPGFELEAWDVVETGDADTIEKQAIVIQRLTQELQKSNEQVGKLEQKLRVLGQ